MEDNSRLVLSKLEVDLQLKVPLVPTVNSPLTEATNVAFIPHAPFR